MTKWPMARQHSRTSMANKLTDHQYLLEHWLSKSQLPRQTSQEYIRFERTLKGIFLGYMLRAGGGWSVDLMIPDYEDLLESEASEIYVKRFKSQEVFVTGEYEFPGRPRLSSTAEGQPRARRWCSNRRRRQNGKQNRSMSGKIIYRHHEEPRLKLYDPSHETFADPLEIRRRNETN